MPSSQIPNPNANNNNPQPAAAASAASSTAANNPLQVTLIMDKTASMQRAIDAAKQSLTKAIDGACEASTGKKELSVICYEDYPTRQIPYTRGIFSSPSPRTTIMPYLKDETDPRHKPIFVTDTTRVKTLLNSIMARGGDDTCEMLESALALATLLPWNTDGKSVQTIYLALDALPHAHLKNHYSHLTTVSGDNFQHAASISAAQQHSLLPNIPCFAEAQHPEDWLTQCIKFARKGIVINPIICITTDNALTYFATFVAVLTGGTPVFLPNNNFENFERYVRENTSLDFAELNTQQQEQFIAIQAQRDSLRVSCELLFPSAGILQETAVLMSNIKATGLFEPNNQFDAYELAEKIRPLYEQYVLHGLENIQREQAILDAERNIRNAVLNDEYVEHIAVLRGEATARPWIFREELPFANPYGSAELGLPQVPPAEEMIHNLRSNNNNEVRHYPHHRTVGFRDGSAEPALPQVPLADPPTVGFRASSSAETAFFADRRGDTLALRVSSSATPNNNNTRHTTTPHNPQPHN